MVIIKIAPNKKQVRLEAFNPDWFYMYNKVKPATKKVKTFKQMMKELNKKVARKEQDEIWDIHRRYVSANRHHIAALPIKQQQRIVEADNWF